MNIPNLVVSLGLTFIIVGIIAVITVGVLVFVTDRLQSIWGVSFAFVIILSVAVAVGFGLVIGLWEHGGLIETHFPVEEEQHVDPVG